MIKYYKSGVVLCNNVEGVGLKADLGNESLAKAEEPALHPLG
jgi:hypothetical protein